MELNIKQNVDMLHDQLMERSNKYRQEDTEGKAIMLSNATQDYYYDVVGVSSNNIWHGIDDYISDKLGVEYF